jgi:hypothetical protein
MLDWRCRQFGQTPALGIDVIVVIFSALRRL